MIKATTINECITTDVLEKEIIPLLRIHTPSCLYSDIADNLRYYLGHLRPNITIIIEDEYIDKVYRDSYYSYYSTKLKSYNRSCLRLSFIDCDIEINDIYTSPEVRKNLKENYLGFMILRPVWPGCVGRTAIMPKALINGNILICSTPIRSSVLGIHTVINAFPHSSQDSEIMTCAETSIWAIMEYFGNKYPEYSPILPSQIINILANKSSERQIPSHGLTYLDISYVLKSQGFGCKVYAKVNYTHEFKRIFSCYIESGIPIAVALTKPGLGHAILCIGRTQIPQNTIDSIPYQTLKSGQKIRLWNDAVTDFVFIDDNHPCYQIANFDNPVAHYHPDWKGCEISHFIVPLYKKIYLDAPNAINYSLEIMPLLKNIPNDIVSRTFLASNHTYKDYIMNDPDMPPAFKDFLLEKIHFPKFIWITEISEYNDFLNEKVNGFILLDATEPLTNTFTSLIYACYADYNIFLDQQNSEIQMKQLSLCSKFNSFNRNLR